MPKRIETMEEFLDLSVGLDIFCFHEVNLDFNKFDDIAFYHVTPRSTWVARTSILDLPIGTAVYLDA